MFTTSLQYYRLKKISEGQIDLNTGAAHPLKGPSDVGTGQDDQKIRLSELINIRNERFGTNFTQADGGYGSNHAAIFINPIGEWKRVCGTPGQTQDAYLYPSSSQPANSWGISLTQGFGTVGLDTVKGNMSACFDGTYALTHFTIFQATPAQVYGVLDGVDYCPGIGNSSENLITIGAVDHLVVQNVFRTAVGEYLTMKLE